MNRQRDQFTTRNNFHPRNLIVNFSAKKVKDTDQGFCDTPGMLSIWAHGIEFSATVCLSEPAYAIESWSIGFVQTVTSARATHKYGSVGKIERLVHPLVSGRQFCINDSDGSAMPFFDDEGSKVDIYPGQVRPQVWNVGYQDWPDSRIENDFPPLTCVDRKSEYRVWLVAIRWSPKRDTPHPTLSGPFKPGEDHITVLGHCAWSFHLSCRLNPQMPVGRRIINFSFNYEDEPVILPKLPLPLSALVGPTYAAAISSIWIPGDESTKYANVRQYPTEITVDWETWKREILPDHTWWNTSVEEIEDININISCEKDRILKKSPEQENERQLFCFDINDQKIAVF